MRARGCDRDCKSCALLGLCGGIKQYGVKGYRCPYAGCELKAPALKKMSECEICPGGWAYWDMSEEEVRRLISDVANLKEVKGASIELPKIVPTISLRCRQSFCWDSLDIGAVVVSFEDFLDEDIKSEVDKAGDIHSYLDFSGQVLVSSIMPDDLITQMDFFHHFVNFAQRNGFNAAIGWDSPVYIDMPLYDSWVNLLMGLKLTHELAGRMPVIGLVKGNVERQIAFSASVLGKIGIRDMALHVSEYMMVYKRDSTVRQIIYTYLEHVSKLADSMLMVGALKPSSLSFFMGTLSTKLPKLSVAGLSWFLDAERGLLYSDRGYIDATSKFVECGCATCSSMRPRDLMTDLGAKARHNLNYVTKQGDSSIAASPPDVSTYDLVLERDEKMLLVSNLHLWTDRALLDEFADFIAEERPANIAFLGNTFDFERGTPDILETAAFFRLLREIGPLVMVTKGCSDSDQEKFLSALDVLTMEGRIKPMLYAKPDDTRFHGTALDFLRFYRSAKERLEIKLANGDLVVARHGHDIVEDPGLSLDLVAERMEEARRRARARWLIVGHPHEAFIDEARRIASSGCWALSDRHEEMKAKKEDLRSAIVVHGDGMVELRRRG